MAFVHFAPPTDFLRKAKTGFAVLALILLFSGEGLSAVGGWPLYIALNSLVALAYVVIMWRYRHRIAWQRLPAWLVLFLLMTVASVFASVWVTGSQAETAITWLVTYLLITLIAVGIILTQPWTDFIRALGTSLRWVIALSLGTELLVVWAFGPGPIFSGGPITGVTGSADLLGLVAIVATGVFITQLYDRTVWRTWGLVWVGVALATIALTRTPSVIATFIVAAVACLFALWGRHQEQPRRRLIYVSATIIVIVVGSALGLWTAFFGDLSILNQWLIPALPGGVLLAIAFTLLNFGMIWRSWFIAVDRPQWDLDDRRPYLGSTLVPLLISVAALTQGVGAFGSIFGAAWALVVMIAIVTKTPWRLLAKPSSSRTIR